MLGLATTSCAVLTFGATTSTRCRMRVGSSALPRASVAMPFRPHAVTTITSSAAMPRMETGFMALLLSDELSGSSFRSASTTQSSHQPARVVENSRESILQVRAAHGRIADAVVAVLDVTRKLTNKVVVTFDGDHEVVPAEGTFQRPLRRHRLARPKLVFDRVAAVAVASVNLGGLFGLIGYREGDAESCFVVMGANVEIGFTATGDAALESAQEPVRTVNRETVLRESDRTQVPFAGEMLVRLDGVGPWCMCAVGRAHLKHRGRFATVREIDAE